MAKASGATSSVITEPEPVKAPSPTRTGATSAVSEPMKAPAPMWVSDLSKPS